MSGVRRGRALKIDHYLASRTPEQRRADFFRTLPERIRFYVGRVFAREHYESGNYYRHGLGPNDKELLVYREFRRGRNQSKSASPNPLTLILGILFMIGSIFSSLSSITGFYIFDKVDMNSSFITITLFVLGVCFLYFNFK